MSDPRHASPTDRAREVLETLDAMGDRSRLAGMARYGIDTRSALGISIPDLRRLARRQGRDHALADELWTSGIHEARLLATMLDDPAAVTEAQMERWVADLDSWDVCDQLMANLFDRTPFAFAKAADWSTRPQEFVKRAGFALMATLAVHRKDVDDAPFEALLPLIRQQATDDRNYVRKAVSWALRQIGKRTPNLNARAIVTAHAILEIDAPSARWIARDALRELEGAPVRRRLRARG
jgi:3-methyladenine DNA glycosylase AlkD